VNSWTEKPLQFLTMPASSNQNPVMEDAEQGTLNDDPEETKPLVPKPPAQNTSGKELFQMFFWSTALIVVSSALINYNKYLVSSEQRFPFPVALVMLHNASSTIFLGILINVCPSMFPALKDETKKVAVDASFLLKRMCPVGFMFAGSLGLSNTAYEFASVAFLQMVKQSNVVICWVGSLFVGLEVYKNRLAACLVMIVVSTAFTVKGEMHFSLAGLLIQLACNFVESSKIISQSFLLSGHGRKLDPLSFVLIISPICFTFLSILVAVHVYISPMSWIVLPTYQDFVANRHALAGNVAVAITLNVVTASFLKHGSPMSFLCTNLLKDALIVVASAWVLGEQVSTLQTYAFGAQLVFISIWTLMKTYPAEFEKHGTFKGLCYIFGDITHKK